MRPTMSPLPMGEGDDDVNDVAHTVTNIACNAR